MIGEVRRGPGWRPREDHRYQSPISLEKLRSANLNYVRRRTFTSRSAPYAYVMSCSTQGGGTTRTTPWPVQTHVIGTCRTWTHSWRPCRGTSLRPRPCHPARGRERQGQDTPRGGLEEVLPHGPCVGRPHTTMWGTSPPWQGECHHIHIFGRDLLNAYRQWPVTQRHVPPHGLWSDAVVPHGNVLWSRSVSLELQLRGRSSPGCSCSSWGATTWTASIAWSTPSKPTNHAFHAFSDFFHIVGLRIKQSKAQPPGRQHVLQGVDVHIDSTGVTLSPTPRRVQKLRHAISQALQHDCLTPSEAGRLAGKLSFLTQAVFGAVGRSAMQPLYARSHDTSTFDDQSLFVGLTSALKALHCMLVQDQLQAVIFANAYVRTGETIPKPATSPLTPCFRHTPGMTTAGDTWVRIGSKLWYCHRTTPNSVLRQSPPGRARPCQTPPSWLAFIDNTAGEAALKKGYGKESGVQGQRRGRHLQRRPLQSSS